MHPGGVPTIRFVVEQEFASAPGEFVLFSTGFVLLARGAPRASACVARRFLFVGALRPAKGQGVAFVRSCPTIGV